MPRPLPAGQDWKRALRRCCLEASDTIELVDQSADHIADQTVDRIIATLRRDARIPALSYHQWSLLLGDARRDLQRELAADLRDYAHDLIEAIVDHLEDLL
jgi:hypothetical protein